MRLRATLSAFALIAVAVPAAQAQQAAAPNPIEVGIDAQIGFGLDDQGTTIAIPAQKIRAGFMINPAMTIEPSLGFFRAGADGASFSTTALDVSLLYHFSQDRAVRQFYVRPVVGIFRVSADNGTTSDATTFMNVGVGGGVKIPLMDRIGARLEAEFRNQLEKDGIPSQSALNLNFGLSYFTR